MVVSSSLEDYFLLMFFEDIEELLLEPVVSFPVIVCSPIVGGCLIYVTQQNESVSVGCLFELFLKPLELVRLLVCLFLPELRVVEESVQGDN